MGFREGAYATVWEVRPGPGSGNWTKGRISVSRKTEQGEYESDFDEYVMFIGSAAANKALQLKPKDRIRLLRVDATTTYDRERNTKYHNYKIFEFEDANRPDNNSPQSSRPVSVEAVTESVDSGEPDDSDYPF